MSEHCSKMMTVGGGINYHKYYIMKILYLYFEYYIEGLHIKRLEESRETRIKD